MKVLTRKIEANREVAIAHLRRAINSLTHIAKEPGCGFVGGYITDYESMLLELEALNPAGPPSLEEMWGLSTRLARLDEELGQSFLDAGYFPP